MITDVAQIALAFADVGRAKSFYVDTLGLKHLFDAGPNLTFVAAGSVRLMLTRPQGAGVPGQNSVVYFRMRSLEHDFGEVISRGAVIEREPQLAAKLPDHELWIGFVRDPEGNLIGLIEERR